MNRSLNNVLRLARKAYRGADSLSARKAPFGFSTRVAARWVTAGREPSVADIWQRLCWWGAAASLLICLTSALYQTSLPEPNAFDVLLEEPGMEVDDF